MKYIYKITNKINGKIYVGQSLDYLQRWREHCQNKKDNSLIAKAIKKYGKDNFDLEVLELTDEPDKRELYWILYYDSVEKGYNLIYPTVTAEPPIFKKIRENYDFIIEKLIYSFYTMREIAEFCNIDEDYIARINAGNFYYLGKETVFPIRENKNKLSLTYAQIIKEDLKGKTSYKELAEKYNCSEKFLVDLNNGRIYYSDSFSYPIRVSAQGKISINQVKEIESRLKEELLTIKDIAGKYSLSRKTITEINKGAHKHSSADLEFPIRKGRISNK